ncbi:MAG: PhoH family protein [Verrucomicrobiales bacterium]
MTETIEFPDARTLQTLFANDPKLLKEMEQALDLRVTTRDGWVKFVGDSSQVARAREVFSKLLSVRNKGISIGPYEFRFALNSTQSMQNPSPSVDQASADDLVERMASMRILTSPKRPPIVPRTAGQLGYLEALRHNDVVFGIGPAGTGKTYLGMAMAVNALKKEEVDRIVLTRPAVEAGEALGFLPGNLQEKIFPYLRPLYDALHDMLDAEEVQRYMDRGIVEIAPLAYMRGRTLNRAFVILDEAQNTTTEQMFMLLTRLGERSKCVITGDVTQIDLPRNKMSGLVEARLALKNVPGISVHELGQSDVVRHPLVRAIIEAYATHRAEVGDPSHRPPRSNKL